MVFSCQSLQELVLTENLLTVSFVMWLITTRIARMYRFCFVCVSVCFSLAVCPELCAHLTDFVHLLITFKHCLGTLTKNAYPLLT